MRQSATKPIKDFWTSFAEELKREGEKRPPGDGWKTCAELVPILKQHKTKIPGMMKKGMAMGKIEMFDGMVYRNGFLRRATWYRQKRP